MTFTLNNLADVLSHGLTRYNMKMAMKPKVKLC